MKAYVTASIIATTLGLAGFAAAADVSNGNGSDKLTAHEAQSLSDQDLAHRVLGAAGSLVLTVDRPVWSRPPWQQKGPWPPPSSPPLDRLIFYGRPVVTGSQFGICGSEWITVDFDGDGRVKSLEAESRYGVEGPIDAKPGSWTYEQSESICAKVTSTKFYFPAPGAEEALVIALYAAAIRREASSGKPLHFTCDHRVCQPTERKYLAHLDLSAMNHARTVDCPNSSLRQAECYELVFNEGKVGSNPQTLRVVGTDYLNRLIIENVTLKFDETLQ